MDLSHLKSCIYDVDLDIITEKPVKFSSPYIFIKNNRGLLPGEKFQYLLILGSQSKLIYREPTPGNLIHYDIENFIMIAL